MGEVMDPVIGVIASEEASGSVSRAQASLPHAEYKGLNTFLVDNNLANHMDNNNPDTK